MIDSDKQTRREKERNERRRKNFEYLVRTTKVPRFTGVHDMNNQPIYSCDAVKDLQTGRTHQIKRGANGDWMAVYQGDSSNDPYEVKLDDLVHHYANENHLYKDDECVVVGRRWRGTEIRALLERVRRGIEVAK